ncbi:hypothetical protein [Algoriphagus sp. CAU 1675]|uniref:hypothetical protein n=1 Tax=Algoriphagus sp. CAU 1675 TaxID=3032597 RepID=UPI0023DCC80B|nr:hypothetical protein [Algoriphagus sp. CAU 1675]MDF2156742.1 hypothetical protein [Algoriphagus sp. CAU 1675]
MAKTYKNSGIEINSFKLIIESSILLLLAGTYLALHSVLQAAVNSENLKALFNLL